MRTQRKRRYGISLVEAMVSLALLSMAIVGSLTTYPMLARMSRSTRLQSQALYYAQAKADDLLHLASLALLPAAQAPQTDYVGATGTAMQDSYKDSSTTDIANYPMTRSYTITAPSGTLDHMTDVQVTVTWTDTSSNPPATHAVNEIFSY